MDKLNTQEIAQKCGISSNLHVPALKLYTIEFTEGGQLCNNITH